MGTHHDVIRKSDLSPIDKERATVLVAAYEDQWKDFQGEVVAAEKDFRVKLPGAWQYVGKIDLLLRDDQGLILVEHKTRSAADIRQPWDPYYLKLSFDSQLTGYHAAQWSTGEQIRKTIYDVVKKITTKPKTIPKGSDGALGTRSEMELHNTYYGAAVVDDEAVTLKKENADLYGLRILHEVESDPDKYFYRYTHIERNDDQMRDHYMQLVAMSQDMDRAKATNSYYQNTSNCLSYGQRCEYFGLCDGTAYEEDSERWRERGGSDLSGDCCISHSRATCFQSCRRKYFWRYDKKIEPIKPESPALRFGKVFHSSLEAYWNWRKQCQK